MHILILTSSELMALPEALRRDATSVVSLTSDRDAVKAGIRAALARLESNGPAKAKAVEGLLRDYGTLWTRLPNPRKG